MTYVYKSKQEAKPLPAKVTVPITHVLETPQRTRRMQLSIPPEYVAVFVASGWHIVEDYTKLQPYCPDCGAVLYHSELERQYCDNCEKSIKPYTDVQS